MCCLENRFVIIIHNSNTLPGLSTLDGPEYQKYAPNVSPPQVKIKKTTESNKRKMFDLNSNARPQLAFDDRTAFAITKNVKSKLKI